MTRTIRTFLFAVAGLAFVSLSTPARAEGKWAKDHPRREETNNRLKNQNKRIKEGEKEGKISKGQAAQLHEEHQEIRSQERADAAKHGGHITKGEQRQLNHEENAESKQIYNEKH
jgi:hypothetical protein